MSPLKGIINVTEFGAQSNRSNSRGAEKADNPYVIKQNQFDVAGSIQNQGVNMRQANAAVGSNKVHKP